MYPITRKRCRGLILLAVMLPLSLLAEPGRHELTLQEAVSLAVERSPMLAAMDARLSALATVPSQARALPDPMLSINAMSLPVDTFDIDQEPMTQLQVVVSQPLPFPGKRSLKESLAEIAVEEQVQMTEERRQQIVSQVRATWWQLFSAEQSLAIIGNNRALLSDFVEIARTKYSVGKGLQQDVLLAELELSRLQERELGIRGMRDVAAARLAGLVSLPAGSVNPVRQDVVPPKLPELPPVEMLASIGVSERGLIDAHRSRIDAARERVALAEKDRYPDFRVGVGYGLRDGEDAMGNDRPDFVSVMFSMNLPLFSGQKQDRRVVQMQAEQVQQQRMLDDALQMMSAELGTLRADYVTASSQARLLDNTIIPQARQTVTAMMAGYQVNKVDFLNVINGQIMLYNAEINYWGALAKAKGALAKLAAIAGRESLYE